MTQRRRTLWRPHLEALHYVHDITDHYVIRLSSPYFLRREERALTKALWREMRGCETLGENGAHFHFFTFFFIQISKSSIFNSSSVLKDRKHGACAFFFLSLFLSNLTTKYWRRFNYQFRGSLIWRLAKLVLQL